MIKTAAPSLRRLKAKHFTGVKAKFRLKEGITTLVVTKVGSSKPIGFVLCCVLFAKIIV